MSAQTNTAGEEGWTPSPGPEEKSASETSSGGIAEGRADHKYVVLMLKIGLGVGIVLWLVSSGRLDLSVYESLFRQRNAWILAGLVLVQFAAMSLLVGRWWLLVRAQQIELSLTDVLLLGYRGMYASLFLPGFLGLEGMRVLHLKRFHSNQLPAGIASLLIDRAIGFLGLLILAVFFGFIYLVQHSSTDSFRLFIVAGGLLVSLTTAIGMLCGFVPIWSGHRFRETGRFASFFHSLSEYQHHRVALFAAVVVSTIGHMLMIFAAYCGLSALGIPASFVSLAAVVPLIVLLSVIPITPLGLGIQDGAAEGLYPIVGLSGGAENQMLLRTTWVLLLLVCGFSFLLKLKDAARKG